MRHRTTAWKISIRKDRHDRQTEKTSTFRFGIQIQRNTGWAKKDHFKKFLAPVSVSSYARVTKF